MKTKEMYVFLGTVRSLRKKEKRLREQIEDLRFSLLPSGITYDKEKVQTSPEDTTLNTFARLDELEGELRQIVVKLYSARVAITNKALILPPKERQVILRYYVDCWTVSQVSNELQITERHAFRLKENAVSMLCKVSEVKND